MMIEWAISALGIFIIMLIGYWMDRRTDAKYLAKRNAELSQRHGIGEDDEK